ncbi:MAG: NADH-quinone oxidoreductase subunit J [Actinobacteria bacterium]|nr:NADH-quinone oxidoreductase subunit J [Actinomycetota bacterium]
MIDGIWLALLFWPLSAAMLLTGLYVFITSSMVRAGLLLMASLGIEGLLFVMLGGRFLGVLTLLMMAVEMVVMVFFMVMFMPDPGGRMGMDMTHQKRTATVLAAATGIGLATVAALVVWPTPKEAAPPGVDQIGYQVMGRSMLVFLFAGVVLMFTMIGATMLASRRGRYEEEGS